LLNIKTGRAAGGAKQEMGLKAKGGGGGGIKMRRTRR
jgi:hypothetical protein